MPATKVVKFNKRIMVPCLKINENILNISIGMCPIMHTPLVIPTADSSCLLVSSCITCNEWSTYSIINVMASNHTIKLIITSTGTCHSILVSTIQANTRK